MLYVVGTPIGNLEDLTARAKRVLGEVDWIAAEDTRVTLKLLNANEIRRPLVSFHEHNEASRTVELVGRLRDGQNGALVSDAGMPGVSDPGRRLLAACAAEGIPFQMVPGPSAVTTAFAGCGFQSDGFHFGGFLPVKQGRRARELEAAARRGVASLFFESPHRLVKSLELFANISPEQEVCVCRELTKIHEEFRHGTPAQLAQHYTARPPKGEIVIVIAPAPKSARRMAEKEIEEEGGEHCDEDDAGEMPFDSQEAVPSES